MPVYPRKKKAGLKYWYKFDYQGETYYTKAIYDTKKEAKTAESEKYKEVSSNEAKSPQKPILSLQQAINDRLDYLLIKRSENYYKDNKRYYAKLLQHIGDIPIRDITKKQIQDFLLQVSEEVKSQGKDNYSINAMIDVYKALFNLAIDNYELPMRNPCKGIEPFPVKRKIKYIPSDGDIEAIKKLCNDQQILLIDFVMETGARISEALRVTGNDLLTEFVILYTRKSKNSDLVPRKLPVPDCIQGIQVKPHKRLFKQWVEKPKFLERKVELLNQRAWNWHNLRHRRASLWNKEGKSLFEIMSLLGHGNLSTTQKYLHLLP